MRISIGPRVGLAALFVAAAAAAAPLPAWGSGAGETSRASVAPDGRGANHYSFSPTVSARGDVVAFDSFADNLIEGDTNRKNDVFVRDRTTGTTTRASVASDGTEANGASDQAEISGDGRFVAFSSWADNLVGDDDNGLRDVFVHDRVTGATLRVSVASDGSESQGGPSSDPVISSDGRVVAFSSSAANLSPLDTNSGSDIYVHDVVTGETQPVSLNSAGNAAGASFEASISGTGRHIAFASGASDIVAGDTNNSYDVFVWDRMRATMQRVSVTSDGTEALGGNSVGPSISKWGRFIAFHSGADNLVPGDDNRDADVFLHNRRRVSTMRISETPEGDDANGRSLHPSVTARGRVVAFASFADNLADDDGRYTDIFWFNRRTRRVKLLSNGMNGYPANDDSDEPAISARGRIVAWHSRASNLVAGDDNEAYDIFVYDPHP